MPVERPGSVAGIVLAAGASTRMGENKLLLRLEGESILRRVVRRTLVGGLDPVIVVLGHEADRALDELADLSCRPIVNRGYALGKNSSLRAGLAAVPADAAAIVVVLADMPFVTDLMVAALVKRYWSAGAPLVLSDYAGAQAPPTLYDRSLFAELDAIEDGDDGTKRVIRRHASEAAAVAFPSEAIRDLDSPEDYERSRS